jgi:hypothetical protein
MSGSTENLRADDSARIGAHRRSPSGEALSGMLSAANVRVAATSCARDRCGATGPEATRERRAMMGHWFLHAQAWWDAQRFDQPGWDVATWRDQKARHIQLHVAKALGKVVAALGTGASTVSDTHLMARVGNEVLPDMAMYRSQLLNLFPEVGAPSALAHRSAAGDTPTAESLLQVVLSLSRASAQLAAYLEPREHGAASPVSHIREAIADLQASAEALAAVFAVDLARAHQARLEALLGAPLPASLVEEGKLSLGT